MECGGRGGAEPTTGSFRGRKKSCGSGAPRLGAKLRCRPQRLREATVATAGSPRRARRTPLKPLRREGWRDAADTCCCRALAQPFLRGGRGCLAGTWSSLRPRCFRGGAASVITRARSRRGKAKVRASCECVARVMMNDECARGNTHSVVAPAQAGAHTAESLNTAPPAADLRSDEPLGLWAPACAGATRGWSWGTS
jgi:hypothetical protein